jgi:hypothetical protein
VVRSFLGAAWALTCARISPQVPCAASQRCGYVCSWKCAPNARVLAPRTHRNASIHPPHPNHSDYLLLTLSSGCEPTNRLYYVDLKALPRDEAGVLALAAYDRRKGDAATPLPIVKLVDNFEASWDYVANEGPVFTFHTNYKAPRNR